MQVKISCRLLVFVMAVTAIWFGAQCGRAETVPTTTTLAISSVGGSIARGGSVSSGSAVTLSATVMAGTAAVTVGQVNFSDASAPYCTDIHLLGTAQLTGGGLAVFRLMPGIGSHAYKAVFLGTPNGVSAYAGEQLHSAGALRDDERGLADGDGH